MVMHLSTELEEYVLEQVQSGRFESVEAVIENALRCLQLAEEPENQDIENLREAVLLAKEQMNSGQYVLLTPQVVNDIKRRGRERLELKTAEVP